MSAVGFLYAFFRSLRLKIKNSGQALKQFDFLNDSTRSKMLKSKVTHNADAIITSVATPAEPRDKNVMTLRKFNCLRAKPEF